MPSQPNSKYAPTTWGTDLYYDFECPSGQTVQLKKVGLAEIMMSGMIDEMDVLGALMEDAVIKPASGKAPQDRQSKKLTKKQQTAKEEAAAMDLMKDPKQLEAMMRAMEKIVPVVVVQPVVVSPWTKDEDGKQRRLANDERTEGVIYSDTVGFEDQMAIFGEAMGDKSVEELATFRDQSESPVGDLEDEPVL
jgi:hypothetical protein